MNWLTDFVKPKLSSLVSKKESPNDLWTTCSKCNLMLYKKEHEKNLFVCSHCDQHMYVNYDNRFKQLFDDQNYEIIEVPIENNDPLNFKDLKKYKDRLKDAQKKTNQKDAALVAKGKIDGQTVFIFLLDFSFMGGSMGQYVGEAFKIGCQKAIEQQCPFISISSSGGARMQEGLVSLMQLPKTVAAVNLLDQKKIPFISVLTHPTTGGVSASFAMLGDVIIAEKGSMIGFAGKRVIEKTINEQLPEDFQTAEYLLDHGMIDMVVHRKELRNTLSKVLSFVKK
tara:strand:- start:4125 stop:4970 length:846 start_codon:yes stop_codon:yes gene_type:complete